MPHPPASARRALLADGSLRLEFDPTLAPSLERWLPLLPDGDPGPAPAGAAVIRAGAGAEHDFPAPADDALPERPTLRLGSVVAWVPDGPGRTVLRGKSGSVEGRLSLSARESVLHAAGGARVVDELYSALTISSALLLGRLGRALVHAAAVVAPGGGAWLLVGDTHAGKTTTTVNLIAAGWDYVSDDHVVLSRDEDSGGISVEGWPRRFHLDAGWETGSPGQPRGEVDPRERWPGRWRRTAPLAGLLFPAVEADRPTRLLAHPAGEALAGLLRQSPWLLADRGAAPGVLTLLQQAAEAPAHGLRLGLDTYRDAPRLADILRTLSAR